MGHMIFPFHAYLLLKYFILYNIINEYNILQHIISKIILEHLDHSNPMYALIIYTTQTQCMRTWQSNRSPHWKRQTWYVSILASPVFRALDGSFILLFFTWTSLYIIELYITCITWLIARRLWFKPHRPFHCHLKSTPFLQDDGGNQ